MRSSGRRRFAQLAVVIGLLCVLTSCIKVDYALEVNEDDTLSGVLLFAIDREVLTMDGKSEREALRELQKDAEQDNDKLPGVTRVEPYREGGYLGQRVFFENVPFEKFASKQKGMGLRLEHVGDEYRFESTVEPAKSSPKLKGLDEAVTASMRIRISISFPGDISETNGRLVDDRTAAWRLDADRRNQLRAVAADEPPRALFGGGEPASGNGSGAAGSGDRGRWLWYGLAGVLILAVAGGVTGGLLERRRRT